MQTVTKQVACRSPNTVDAVPGFGVFFLALGGIYSLTGGLDGGSVIQVNDVGADIGEFEDDLNRTKYLKRLFKKYENSRVLKERLILNHIIIFNNVFGTADGLVVYKDLRNALVINPELISREYTSDDNLASHVQVGMRLAFQYI